MRSMYQVAHKLKLRQINYYMTRSIHTSVVIGTCVLLWWGILPITLLFKILLNQQADTEPLVVLTSLICHSLCICSPSFPSLWKSLQKPKPPTLPRRPSGFLAGIELDQGSWQLSCHHYTFVHHKESTTIQQRQVRMFVYSTLSSVVVVVVIDRKIENGNCPHRVRPLNFCRCIAPYGRR